MKIKNGDLPGAIAAMVQICCTGNRLESVASARAYRIKEGLAKAWESVDAERVRLCKDHGELNEEGTSYDFPTTAARREFEDAWKKLQEEEREHEIETLAPAELDGGWFRGPDGKKDKFDLNPEHRGILSRVGIVAEPKPAEG